MHLAFIRLNNLWLSDQFFFFLPSLFWMVICSFLIPYYVVKMVSSSSTKLPCTTIYFPAFFPGRFWTVALLANLTWSWWANPWICLTNYSGSTLEGANDSIPIILVTFLLMILSAISCIPLKVPSLNIKDNLLKFVQSSRLVCHIIIW